VAGKSIPPLKRSSTWSSVAKLVRFSRGSHTRDPRSLNASHFVRCVEGRRMSGGVPADQERPGGYFDAE
jgi:hypothetical protein